MKILSHWKFELDRHADGDHKNRWTSLTKYGYFVLNMKKERFYTCYNNNEYTQALDK